MRNDPPPSRFFLVHIMKTGGTSLLKGLLDNYEPHEVYPEQGEPLYASVDRLRSVSPDDLMELKVVSGHFPYVVTELVRPDVCLTVLRDPVERTISLLRHCKRYVPHMRDHSLEAIYEDPFMYPLMIRDYQVKQFALSFDDDLPDKAHLADVVVTDARLAAAKANLDQVEVIGLQDRYDELLVELSGRFGWEFRRDHRWHQSTDDSPVPTSLRNQITGDLTQDLKFFEYALELHEERRTA